MQADYLIIGSGIAGLSYTVKVADYFQERQIPIKIALITKTVAEETNTKYAQGGIATVWDTADSFEKHIDDTMVAGDFVSDRKVVEIVVKEAPERLKELTAPENVVVESNSCTAASTASMFPLRNSPMAWPISWSR
mgnify:CR=1 FL=1